MSTKRVFSKPVVAALGAAKIVGVRSGTKHRSTGVWVVVVKRRAFARSWSDRPDGWFRAFLAKPQGTIEIPTGREVRVRAKKVTGERLLDAIDAAYATKYDTAASQKWVEGFAEPERRATTIEFVPR